MDAARRFVFRHGWHMPHAPSPVAQVLVDLGRYPQWWPQVRAVVRLGEDDAWVRCRSLLPYTLDLRLHAESRVPPVLETSVTGDLSSAWLARLARPWEPLLRWNHRVMMAGARRGLAEHLAASGGPTPLSE